MRMNIHKQPAVILTAILLITLSFCGKTPDPPSTNLPARAMWEKNQVLVNPTEGTANTWSGFDVKGGFFVPNKAISKFILWRDKEEGKAPLALQYILKSGIVKVFINSKNTFKLSPAGGEVKEFSATVPLNKGFNFIEFRKMGKGEFKIKTLEAAGKQTEAAAHQLTPGTVFAHYHPAGAGRIVLSGGGDVRIRQVEFVDGEKKVTETEAAPGFMSKTIEHPFHFKSQGFIKISALSGEFNITEYTYVEKKQLEKETVAPPAETGSFAKEKPGIHILLIDGCHAEHLGAYGYRRDTSPNIDKLAKDSVIFDNAYANATFTRSSVASIFTGFHPHRHKLRVLVNRLPGGLFMLPEFMQKQGYKTAILTEAGNISRKFGFSQGVDNYQKIFRRWDDPRYLENNMFQFFAKWMTNQGPLFTYVHYRAPHFPIVPPPPYKDMYAKDKKADPDRDRVIFHLTELGQKKHTFTPREIREVIDDYDSAIRYVDAEVGKLVDKLKQLGQYESSLIIFTSDHGEALYEHKMWGHGVDVHNETSQVPLMVKFPAKMKLKGRVQRLTQLVDIFPTIAQLFGAQRFFDGESLLESMRIKDIDDTFVFSTTFGMPPSIGIRWRSWYYIMHLYNGGEELFHLEKDPIANLAEDEAHKDMVTFFRTKFLHWYVQFDNIERTSQSVDLKKLPKDVLENLKSLGYIK